MSESFPHMDAMREFGKHYGVNLAWAYPIFPGYAHCRGEDVEGRKAFYGGVLVGIILRKITNEPGGVAGCWILEVLDVEALSRSEGSELEFPSLPRREELLISRLVKIRCEHHVLIAANHEDWFKRELSLVKDCLRRDSPGSLKNLEIIEITDLEGTP